MAFSYLVRSKYKILKKSWKSPVKTIKNRIPWRRSSRRRFNPSTQFCRSDSNFRLRSITARSFCSISFIFNLFCSSSVDACFSVCWWYFLIFLTVSTRLISSSNSWIKFASRIFCDSSFNLAFIMGWRILLNCRINRILVLRNYFFYFRSLFQLELCLNWFWRVL